MNFYQNLKSNRNKKIEVTRLNFFHTYINKITRGRSYIKLLKILTEKNIKIQPFVD